MYIKRYTIAAFLLIVLISSYTYGFVTQDSLEINFFGIKFPPILSAIWVAFALILLYLGSVAHILFYSMLNSFRQLRYKKDHEKIVDSIADAYLGKENRANVYKTERYKLLGSIIDSSTLLPAENLNSSVENKKINAILDAMNKIKSGEVVDLRKYSLKPSNELMIQNERNRFKRGEITSENILNSSNKYDSKLRKEVYIEFAKNANLQNIQKYVTSMSKDALYTILERINADTNTLIINNEEIISFFKNLDLSSKDYIEISKKLSKTMLPEQRIKLFEMLSNENELALEAYIFTLFDLEILELANDMLQNSQGNEFIQLKAYSALRECGKHFDINLFL